MTARCDLGLEDPDQKEALEPGDTVFVNPYKLRFVDYEQRLCDGMIDHPLSGLTMKVVRLCGMTAYLESTNERGNLEYGHALIMSLRLISKGRGVFEVGVDRPLSNSELQHQRSTELVSRIRLHDYSYEGFDNAATFLAHMYLNNESGFHKWVKANRRKDGTVNAGKVQREWFRQCFEIDSWAYEIPVHHEEGYDYLHFVTEIHMKKARINWNQVAERFSEKVCGW